MAKAISTLVSSVVLVVIVISIAGILSNWSFGFGREHAGGIASETEEALSCAYADLYIRNVTINCNDCSGTVTATAIIKNNGNVLLKISKFYAINNAGKLFDFVFQQTDISSGSLTSASANAQASCSDMDVDKVVINSNNCPERGYDSFMGRDVNYINCQ
ncbi:MAG: hypothetical protein ABIG30_02460 [Candidatus Aenigmatarchaeota archaeon]